MSCMSVCEVEVVGVLDDILFLLVRAGGDGWLVLYCLYLVPDLVAAIDYVFGVVFSVAVIDTLVDVVLDGAISSPSDEESPTSDIMNRCMFCLDSARACSLGLG